MTAGAGATIFRLAEAVVKLDSGGIGGIAGAALVVAADELRVEGDGLVHETPRVVQTLSTTDNTANQPTCKEG